MSGKLFVSGDEAVALAVRQAKPHVIAAYPITPQTIVVERLVRLRGGRLSGERIPVCGV